MAALPGTPISVLRGINFSLVNHMTDKKAEQEIVTLLAGQLKKHGQVQINGLGTFSITHQKQEQQQDNDGRIVMKPPADVIVFTPEK